MIYIDIEVSCWIIKVFSPTDVQLDSLKNNFKFALKFTLKSSYILFIHQQVHYLLNLERFKIYTRIHTNIAPTCFGLGPS
jgi:hypothetical protein